MDDARRSAPAAALLNLTGVGLGYAYLGRWWRAALHLLVTAGLVVIAFVTGAAALPWLWTVVALGWLGWMAVDGWRIARGWFGPPVGRAGHVRPVAVAVLAVGAVVAGCVLYGAAGRATHAEAVQARDRGDCVAAAAGFSRVATFYELTLSGDVAAAEAGAAECAAFLTAVGAEAAGDPARAVQRYRAFRDARPGTPLAGHARDGLRRVYAGWAASLRAAGDFDGADRVYRELLAEVGDDPDRAAAVREDLAATAVDRAAALRAELPGRPGEDDGAAVRRVLEALLAAQAEFPGTQGAAAAPQAARDTYAAAAATWPGRWCEALPLLEYALTVPDDGTAGVATAARADRPRALFECGLERYAAGEHASAAEAFDVLTAEHPEDPQAAQARANAIAARSADASGEAPALPGPYAGDRPGPLSVTFSNDNPADVRVYVVGPTAHEFTIPACPGCPARYPSDDVACPPADGRPSYELSLPAGQYSIVGVYPDADPSISANTLEDGFDYTNCLYVVGP